MPAVSDSHWSAQDTTPPEIDEALRRMLRERHAESELFVPARALNLIVVVDGAWSGEIANRLKRVGRYHASRTIVLELEPGRTQLDAVASLASDVHPRAGGFAPLREVIVVEYGEQHLAGLETIVDPLVVSDLPTVLWAPHGHPAAVQELLGLVQVVLIDSVDDPDVHAALGRARELSDAVYVVDLAWLRSTPWRERIAATFDPSRARRREREIEAITIRHHPASTAAALLLVGWLASRLGWTPGPLAADAQGTRTGTARADDREVALTLAPAPEQDVRGLAGVSIATGDGRSLSLDRGAGGLRVTERGDGERTWTALGASRGEGGILGEGIRQALLRDPTYRPALISATALAP